MAFRLARMAGRTDVDQMLEGMSSKQFNEWVAFYLVDPPAVDRICRYLVRLITWVASSASGKSLSEEDFVIDFDNPEFAKTEEDHQREVEIKVRAWKSVLTSKFGKPVMKVKKGKENGN